MNLHNDRQRDIYIDKVKSAKLPVTVTIKAYKENKTAAQLRTVHMWLREVQEHYQDSEGKFYRIDALKDTYKAKFGIFEIVDTPEGEKVIFKSFADYKKHELSDFMDKMNHYCGSELQLFLTIPNMPEDL